MTWAMGLQFDGKIFISLALVGLIGLLVRLYDALVVKPERLRSMLRKQGISGSPPTLLLGNIREIRKAQSTILKAPTTELPVSHNCAALLFPFFEKWRKQYGTYIYICVCVCSLHQHLSMSSLSSSSSYCMIMEEAYF